MAADVPGRGADRIGVTGRNPVWFTRAEREAYAELAQIAAQWRRLAEWERARRVRADRAVRRAIAQAPRVNGRPLELTSGSRSPASGSRSPASGSRSPASGSRSPASGSRSLTDTWPGVPMPPASNDEPIPLVTIRRIRRPRGATSAWSRLCSSLLGRNRSGGT